MKKAMLFVLSLLISFSLGGSASAAQTFWGRPLSKLEKVRNECLLEEKTPGEAMPQRRAERKSTPDVKEAFYYAELPLSRELQRHTYELCKEHLVDYELILAMMWHESGFDVDAVRSYNSGMKDCGLLQINSTNAAWLYDAYEIDDLENPEQNIRAGVLILADKVARYGEQGGLMAYNLGDGGYLKAVEEGVSSNLYTDLILKTRAEYETLAKIC